MEDIAIIVKYNCTNEFDWYMFIMNMTYIYKWNSEMDYEWIQGTRMFNNVLIEVYVLLMLK